MSVNKYTMHLFSKAVAKAKKGEAIIVCIRKYDDWNKAYRELDGCSKESDLIKDLGDYFIQLRTEKEGKKRIPITPYFKKNYFGEENYNRFISMLEQ